MIAKTHQSSDFPAACEYCENKAENVSCAERSYLQSKDMLFCFFARFFFSSATCLNCSHDKRFIIFSSTSEAFILSWETFKDLFFDYCWTENKWRKLPSIHNTNRLGGGLSCVTHTSHQYNEKETLWNFDSARRKGKPRVLIALERSQLSTHDRIFSAIYGSSEKP